MTLVTLKQRADFIRLRNNSFKRVMPAFVLQAGPRHGSQQTKLAHKTSTKDQKRQTRKCNEIKIGPRFGFTASKKIGNAVKRNRARRRLKEAIRIISKEKQEARLNQNWDYVVIARQKVLEQNFADLIKDLRLAFLKVHGNKG